MIPDEKIRFVFSGIRGYDYTIRATVFYGKDDTFLSVIPSVDNDEYSLRYTLKRLLQLYLNSLNIFRCDILTSCKKAIQVF